MDHPAKERSKLELFRNLANGVVEKLIYEFYLAKDVTNGMISKWIDIGGL